MQINNQNWECFEEAAIKCDFQTNLALLVKDFEKCMKTFEKNES